MFDQKHHRKTFLRSASRILILRSCSCSFSLLQNADLRERVSEHVGRPAQVYVGVVVGDKVAQEMLPAAKVLGLLAHGLTPMFSVR